MFGLFNKKKEAPAKAPGTPAVSFGVEFEPYELSLLAVTGPVPFQGKADEESGLMKMHLPLSAWMEDKGDELHRGEVSLLAVGDNTLYSFLRQRTPPDFIIKFRGRPSVDGKAILLTGLPEPAFHAELKAVLEEQKKPVSTWVEGLGTFTLNRSLNVLQAEVDWLGRPTFITFDRSEEESGCIQTAKALMADPAGWDEKARTLAADRLLEQAREWAAQSGDEDAEPIDRDCFLTRIAPDNIVVSADGGFQIFFDDGEVFWGQLIHVSGSVTEGVTDAKMEG